MYPQKKPLLVLTVLIPFHHNHVSGNIWQLFVDFLQDDGKFYGVVFFPSQN